MSQNLIEVRGLTKKYGDFIAVNGIDFHVRKGESFGFLGPNGAGKSTTMRIIAATSQRTSGDVSVLGKDPEVEGPQIRAHLGVVPQQDNLDTQLTVSENLFIYGRYFGLPSKFIRSKIEELLEFAQLEEKRDVKVETLSGGMKRRLNIAAALLHDPQLLILDEPTVGIDPQSRNAIFDSLELLKQQGRSLIYTSHYMEEVERLADHIVVIDHGKVIADESPADLYLRLPAAAALQVDLQAQISADTLVLLETRPGVSSVISTGQHLEIALANTTDALPVLDWLAAQGCQALHFGTAKASLEDVFLTLTGRTLRD